MKKRVFLGIDTSNYTTSLALCDENGVILENYKVLLPVKEGGLCPREKFSNNIFIYQRKARGI